jgi:hypothetical protein
MVRRSTGRRCEGGQVLHSFTKRPALEVKLLSRERREAGVLVPVIRIERMTYRLQGGCSAPELNRHGARIMHPLCAYLIRLRVGLPPDGFFGGSGLAGAGSPAGDLGLPSSEAGSASAFVCTDGFGVSASKVMPCPVSRA